MSNVNIEGKSKELGCVPFGSLWWTKIKEYGWNTKIITHLKIQQNITCISLFCSNENRR